MSFFATNLLVYATVPASPYHGRAQTAIIQSTRLGRIAISRQILRAFLAVMTRQQSWARAPSLHDALFAARVFEQMFVVLEDGPAPWATLKFGGKQVHAANIVATMLAHGETRLLTFNIKDFQRFASAIEGVEP